MGIKRVMNEHGRLVGMPVVTYPKFAVRDGRTGSTFPVDTIHRAQRIAKVTGGEWWIIQERATGTESPSGRMLREIGRVDMLGLT